MNILRSRKTTGLFLAALLLTAFFALSACGKKSGSTTQEIDIDAAVQAVLDKGGFTEELVRQEDAVIAKSYPTLDLSQVEDYSCFVSGSMATPEEISVFKAKTSDGAAEIRKAITRRVEDQRLNFEDYRPDEMPKIENAVILEKGNYLFLAICPNHDEALKILESL